MPTAHLQTSGPVEWMTLEASAKLLNKSERTLLQWVKDEKITGKRERDPAKRGQETTFLHAGEVAAIAGQMEAAKKAGTALVRKSASPQLALLHTSESEPDQPVSTRVTPRPWLTLDEAAEYSGLRKSWLYDLAQGKLGASAEDLAISVRDVGPGPGGRWRFHRESLEKA